MEDNPLFANNRKEFIQEFLAAMEGMDCNFQIDTASSGLEAAKLLKKKRYKVVVTGMNLSTFGGAKLIAYLNQYSPYTTCIVYTRRMEPAYLKLLVNELKVFRIFQKPADYEKLYAAIQEGFGLYESEASASQKKDGLDQAIRCASLKIAELEQVSRERPQEKEAFLCFMQGLLKAFQADINTELAEGEKTRLLRFEGEILQWVLQGHGREARDVPSILQGLAREFHQPDKGREMVIGMEGEEGQAQAFSALYLHFALWLVMARFLAISPAYRVKAQAACLEEGHFRLKVEGSFPEGVWEQKNREGAESAMTNVVHKILGKVAVRFSQAIQEGKVTYQIEI